MAKITIVATYWNRKAQLQNTLRSIAQYGHDVNIIIVDDASTDGEDITCFETDKISVITLNNKTWINPCIPFNIAFSLVNTDIVLIQNAECIHAGDIISHALKFARQNYYITYAAFGVNKQITEQLYVSNDFQSIVSPYMGTEKQAANGENSWYNHSIHRPAAFHFCAAIMRSDLYSLGGFDERYANGSGWDDNEFILRIRKKEMDVAIVNQPFVIHQWHEPFYCGDIPTMMRINYNHFMRTEKARSYDVKSTNKIYK
jgi:glycosyltransferase involved in cell wall biosynthesis